MRYNKWIIIPIFLLVLISILSFSLAQEPQAPVQDQDLQNVQAVTDQIPINPDTGEIDQTKVNGWQTQAEQRIAIINQWLATNTYWLSWIFGMTPELSWLFLLNIYLILFLGVYLIVRIKDIFFFIENENISKIIGAVIFLTLLFTKLILKLAAIILDAFNILWNQILPYVAASVLIATAIVVILAIVLAIFAPEALEVIIKLLAKKKKEREQKGKTKEVEEAEQAMKKLKAFEKGRETFEKD